MGRSLRILLLCQPNRGFLRSVGITRELGVADEPFSCEALRAAGTREFFLKWLSHEERVCSSNAAVYIYKGRVTDRLARMARQHPAMTVGLTTALWLGGALPVRPPIDHWMIADARHRPIWLPPDVRVHRSRHAIKDTFATVFSGAEVRAHTPLRATLDCIRFRAELGDEAVAGAIKCVLANGSVELSTLLAHAKPTKVLKPLLRLLERSHELRGEPEQPAVQ